MHHTGPAWQAGFSGRIFKGSIAVPGAIEASFPYMLSAERTVRKPNAQRRSPCVTPKRAIPARVTVLTGDGCMCGAGGFRQRTRARFTQRMVCGSPSPGLAVRRSRLPTGQPSGWSLLRGGELGSPLCVRVRCPLSPEHSTALLANRRLLHLGAMPIYLAQFTSAHTLDMERSAAASQGGRRTKFQRDKKSNAE